MTMRRRATDTTNDLLIDVLDKLESMTVAQTQTTAARPLECLRSHTPSEHQSQAKDSYTIAQIAAGMMALVSIVGPLIGVWINLNNQISTQKVTYEATIQQIKADISSQRETDKEFVKSVKELNQKLDQLDNSVDQLYNRMNK